MPPQPQQAKQYLSTDPAAGEPIRMGKGASKYLSTDPNAGMSVDPSALEPGGAAAHVALQATKNIWDFVKNAAEHTIGTVAQTPGYIGDLAQAGAAQYGALASELTGGAPPTYPMSVPPIAPSQAANVPLAQHVASAANALQNWLGTGAGSPTPGRSIFPPAAQRALAGPVQMGAEALMGEPIADPVSQIEHGQYGQLGASMGNLLGMYLGGKLMEGIPAGADALIRLPAYLKDGSIMPADLESITAIASKKFGGANSLAQQMEDSLHRSGALIENSVKAIGRADLAAKAQGDPAVIDTNAAIDDGKSRLGEVHQANLTHAEFDKWSHKWGGQLLDWEDAKEARTDALRRWSQTKNPADRAALMGTAENLDKELNVRATQLGHGQDFVNYKDASHAYYAAKGGAWGDAVREWELAKRGGGTLPDFMNAIRHGAERGQAKALLMEHDPEFNEKLFNKRVTVFNDFYDRYSSYLEGGPKAHITGFFHKFLTRPMLALSVGVPIYKALDAVPFANTWLLRTLGAASGTNFASMVLDKLRVAAEPTELFGKDIPPTNMASPEDIASSMLTKADRLAQYKAQMSQAVPSAPSTPATPVATPEEAPKVTPAKTVRVGPDPTVIESFKDAGMSAKAARVAATKVARGEMTIDQAFREGMSKQPSKATWRPPKE